MKITTKIIGGVVLMLCNSCTVTPNDLAVVSTTGTNIGLSVEQGLATGTPAFKFGYNRAEVALVDRMTLNSGSSGEDVPNVLMELNYRSMINGGGGIYQRLAVGKTAVSEDGAAAMFSKDDNGLTPESKKAMSEIPNVDTL